MSISVYAFIFDNHSCMPLNLIFADIVLQLHLSTCAMLHVLQVANLTAGHYNIAAKAVNANGTEASAHSMSHYYIVVTAPAMDPYPPDTSTTDGPPPTETPNPTVPTPESTVPAQGKHC